MTIPTDGTSHNNSHWDSKYQAHHPVDQMKLRFPRPKLFPGGFASVSDDLRTFEPVKTINLNIASEVRHPVVNAYKHLQPFTQGFVAGCVGVDGFYNKGEIKSMVTIHGCCGALT